MKVIDLTVELYDGLQSFPGHPKMAIIDAVTHSFSAPRYILPCKGYASKLVLFSDHSGTHLDAPFHFFENGRTIEEVPLEDTFGRGILIDVAERDQSVAVTKEMLEAKLEEMQETIQEGDIVLIRAWGKGWNEEGYHHAAALDISAAKWLAEQKIKCIGVDLANLDTNSDMGRPCHMELLSQNIGIIENLVHLDQISKPRFLFLGIPLKIKGLSGSPIRAVAIEDFEN